MTKASSIVKCVLWTCDPKIIPVLCNFQEKTLATSYHNWMCTLYVNNFWQIISIHPFVLREKSLLKKSVLQPSQHFSKLFYPMLPLNTLQGASNELLQPLKSTLYIKVAQVTYPKARISEAMLDSHVAQHPQNTTAQILTFNESLSWPERWLNSK